MSASEAVCAAMAAAMRARPAFAGVPVTAAGLQTPQLPHAQIGEAATSDWSAKAMRGREVRTVTIVKAAAGQRERMPALTEAVERAGEGLGGDIGGWRVASAVHLRTRRIAERGRRDVVAVAVEHRVRVMEI